MTNDNASLWKNNLPVKAEALSAEENQFINANQAAHILGVLPSTLENWRRGKKVNLPYFKIGGAVRYRVVDVFHFMYLCQVGRGSE